MAFGRPTGVLMNLADLPIFRGIQAAEGGNMIYGQGAVLIIRDGVLAGAAWMGGGTGERDEESANVGAALVTGG